MTRERVTKCKVDKYKAWHLTLPDRLYMQDIDSIEYRFKQGRRVPVAVIETTEIAEGAKPERYLPEVGKARKGQAAVAVQVAQGLKVPAYYVAYAHDMETFWVVTLRAKVRRWHEMTRERYVEFLEGL